MPFVLGTHTLDGTNESWNRPDGRNLRKRITYSALDMGFWPGLKACSAMFWPAWHWR